MYKFYVQKKFAPGKGGGGEGGAGAPMAPFLYGTDLLETEAHLQVTQRNIFYNIFTRFPQTIWTKHNTCGYFKTSKKLSNFLDINNVIYSL